MADIYLFQVEEVATFCKQEEEKLAVAKVFQVWQELCRRRRAAAVVLQSFRRSLLCQRKLEVTKMEKASFMRILLCEKTLTQIVGSVVDKNSIEAAITTQCAYRHRVQKRQRIRDKCGSVLTQIVESISMSISSLMMLHHCLGST